MVDLAKIRKKAKKAAAEETKRPAAESTAEASSEPPDPSADTQVARPAASSPSETPRPAEPRSTGSASETPRAEEPEPETVSKLERFKAAAGQRREVREERGVEEVTDQLELLAFTIAGEHYAVDIERIVEIVTPRPVTRIPNADPTVVGIISLRGTIVTLVDVRRRLRHPSGAETPDTRIVVIDARNETVGFVVDRVQRVVKLARSAVEPHPVVHSTELEESIRGVFRMGGALTILLDLDKLLEHSHGPDL